MNQLLAISPLDGRYALSLKSLRNWFSEFALIRARCDIELKFLLDLDKSGLFPPLAEAEKERITALSGAFCEADALQVKEIENVTRHDVKSVEYFLRKRLGLSNPNMIHFGLTSEDVNNLSYSGLFRGFLSKEMLPRLRELILQLCETASQTAREPFPTRTHGQPATPSTAGKEIAVYISRLTKIFRKLRVFRFRGKLNGATGTYGAMLAAFPSFDWIAFSRKFVESLGFEFNLATTQIEDHDGWAEFFNLVRQANNIVLDLGQDFWTYLMLGFFTEEAVAGEVGSSTMPHKVNPIRFENGEGNLYIANALLAMLSDKLCRSRMQRDLSDSTVTRNVGVAMAHSFLALGETVQGLKKIRFNPARCRKELADSPQLLAEPVQTILRTVVKDDPYELLKQMTRGKTVSLHDVLETLKPYNLGEERLRPVQQMKPEDYIGAAPAICLEIVDQARKEVGEV